MSSSISKHDNFPVVMCIEERVAGRATTSPSQMDGSSLHSGNLFCKNSSECAGYFSTLLFNNQLSYGFFVSRCRTMERSSTSKTDILPKILQKRALDKSSSFYLTLSLRKSDV